MNAAPEIVIVRYEQIVIGILWAVLRPLLV